MSWRGSIRPSCFRRWNSLTKLPGSSGQPRRGSSQSSRIARRLDAHLHHEDALVGGLLDEIVLRDDIQSREKIRRLLQPREFLGEFCPVPLAQPCDQGLFAVEVDIKSTRRDGGGLADVLHGRPVEAAMGKAALCGVENVLPAGGVRFRFQFWHWGT